jgi:hypothetical protein
MNAVTFDYFWSRTIYQLQREMRVFDLIVANRLTFITIIQLNIDFWLQLYKLNTIGHTRYKII